MTFLCCAPKHGGFLNVDAIILGESSDFVTGILDACIHANTEIGYAGEGEAERNAEMTSRYLEAVALANHQRMLVFQEVLSKPGAETLPLAEQEFYELCIEESDDVFRPGFVVKQTRARWSEIDQQVMWEEPVWERWPTLKKAKEKCEEWRKALAARGFTQSDMELL